LRTQRRMVPRAACRCGARLLWSKNGGADVLSLSSGQIGASPRRRSKLFVDSNRCWRTAFMRHFLRAFWTSTESGHGKFGPAQLCRQRSLQALEPLVELLMLHSHRNSDAFWTGKRPNSTLAAPN